MTVFLAMARAIGAAVVLVPLGVTVSISYSFGSDTFGGGAPIYGVMWASFALVAAVCTFSMFSAAQARVRLASGLIVLVCVLCSGAGSWVSLGARQDQIIRQDARAVAEEVRIAGIRQQIASLPDHRDIEAVQAEQRLRAEARKRTRAAPTAEDRERDLELINELSTIRRASELRALLSANSTERAAEVARATAVVDWVARRLGWSVDAVGHTMMGAFVLTSELVAALGLFCVLGDHVRHSPPPARTRQHPPAPAETTTPSAGAVTAPMVLVPEARASGDPVATFLEQVVIPDAAAITPYVDIEGAWRSWCARFGVDGQAVNLGLALRRAGYETVPMSGRRRGRKGMRLASIEMAA